MSSGTCIFFWPIPACPYLYKMLYKLDQAENPEIDTYLPKSGKKVGQVGLEPTTPCLKGRCSNRLSY